jgi:hypothetical protein
MSTNEIPRRGGQTAAGARNRIIPCKRDVTTNKSLGEATPRFQSGNSPKPNDPLPETVSEWERSGTEVVRVSLEIYGGTPVVNLRLWWRDGVELRPGKGLTLGIRHLPRLAEAITAALNRARELNL